jgi:hypothetical protein
VCGPDGTVAQLKMCGLMSATVSTFATWQAERAIGDHDRNTLRLRLDPKGDQAGLEPGMTVWVLRPTARPVLLKPMPR